MGEAVHHWQAQSTGEVWMATIDGPVDAAVGALTRGDVQLIELSVPEALGRIAWCAGSGAAHAPRRGMGPGRSAAWWVAVQAAGLDWPAQPDELEYELEELRWWTWSTDGDEQGWRLRIAVEDPADDLTVAIDAFDRRVDSNEP